MRHGMKPTERMLLALGAIVFLTLVVVNPFNWTDDDGNAVHVSPVGWMTYGIVVYLLVRVAVSAYMDWLTLQPKNKAVRNSRSHHNTRKGK